MNFEMPNFLPAIPEMYLLGMACIVLLVDLFLTDRTRIVTYYLSQAPLIGAVILTLGQFGQPTQLTFSDTYILDPMANLLKLFALGATFFVFLYSKDYLRERNMFRGEFFTLGLFGVLGMMILISAHNMLTVYMGLELLSLCMYAMVALQRDNVVASEAAMKYFVLGAMASAMLLYGMSMIYGVTGSLDLAEISRAIGSVNDGNIVLVFGLVFIIVGVAFKLGAVPFHMWVPDVYE
ncbi:MAG: NADH-quinone oxidoreductase subunit N, partial [Gammaproteobacteria bacterium]|nr:NADH-quinone oxidoreductase subunit N [Gammaproteobacteria bacterium]